MNRPIGVIPRFAFNEDYRGAYAPPDSFRFDPAHFIKTTCAEIPGAFVPADIVAYAQRLINDYPADAQHLVRFTPLDINGA